MFSLGKKVCLDRPWALLFSRSNLETISFLPIQKWPSLPLVCSTAKWENRFCLLLTRTDQNSGGWKRPLLWPAPTTGLSKAPWCLHKWTNVLSHYSFNSPVSHNLWRSSPVPPAQSTDSWSRLLRAMSCVVLNFSRGGISFLYRQWVQCLSTFTLKFVLVLSLNTTEKSLPPSSFHPIRYFIETQIWGRPQIPCPQGQEPHFSSAHASGPAWAVWGAMSLSLAHHSCSCHWSWTLLIHLCTGFPAEP